MVQAEKSGHHWVTPALTLTSVVTFVKRTNQNKQEPHLLKRQHPAPLSALGSWPPVTPLCINTQSSSSS